MPATALNSKVLLLPLLLALCSFLQVAFGQANYVDPYSSMVSCPYFSTSKSNSATWDNPNTFRCPFDIDMCPGDTIVVSQCTSVTKFSGDGYLRLLTYGNTAVPQQWDKNDDGCGSAVGAQITFTFPNSGTSTLPSAIVNQCRNVTIMSGCFESKSCSGTTVFSFTKRMKRCGFGFYAKYTTTTSSVMDSKGKVTTTTTINVDCARVTAGKRTIHLTSSSLN